MAHFRRRRPRASAHAKMYSQTGWRARHNLKPIKIPEGPETYAEWRDWWCRTRDVFWPNSAPSQLANWPRWWDVLFHTRPTRRRTKQMEIKLRKGQIDPENLCWPLPKKPHSYYW